jgi:excisionase family DNA binding protein
MTQDVLNYDQAAAYLGISLRNLKDLVLRKSIDHFRIGRLVRFNRKDLEAWCKKKTEQVE